MPEVERRIVLRDGEGRELAPRPAKEPELVYFPGGWYALDEEKAEKLRRLMRELGEPVSKTYNPMVPISIPIMPWQTATPYPLGGIPTVTTPNIAQPAHYNHFYSETTGNSTMPQHTNTLGGTTPTQALGGIRMIANPSVPAGTIYWLSNSPGLVMLGDASIVRTIIPEAT